MSGRHSIHPIPFCSDRLTVRIGVTGHRTLPDPELIRRRVGEVLADLDERLADVEHRYRVISPLAEGADRLVASSVLDWKGGKAWVPSQLEIVLPMPMQEYFETFERQESIAEFYSFLPRADPPRVLPAASTHREAYQRAGEYVANHCDVLIAIWDGEKERGEGGTAAIVRFAKSSNCTVFWIHSKSGKIRMLPNRKGFVSQIDFLREYNSEMPAVESIPHEVHRRLEKLKHAAGHAGLDPAMLDPLRDGILSHFVKATGLARRYQNYHFRSVIVAYALSALAVATAAIGALFFHKHWELFALEAFEIVAVMILVQPSWFRSWQRKWIDYRYLAERLRASVFLYAAGLTEETSAPPADLQLSWLPDSWVVVAIRELWKPVEGGRAHRADEARIAQFLLEAWIEPQRAFYADASHRSATWDRWMEWALRILVALTLGAAISHVVMSLSEKLEESWVPIALSVAAVTLPAVAAAVAGISVFSHFNRNAERYESMALHLEEIGHRLEHPVAAEPQGVRQLSAMQQLVREADRSMAHEHQGWRTVFGVHLPGPG